MTGKKNVKTNLKIKNENKDTLNSPRVIADMFNKKILSFANNVEGPTHRSLKIVKSAKMS